MPTACTEQQLLYYGKNAVLDLDVPPSKLLHRPVLSIYVPDEYQDREPKQELDEEQEGEEEEEEEEEVDTYATSSGCTSSRRTAPSPTRGRRRGGGPKAIPLVGHHLPGLPAVGGCPRGDACEFAHGVFECWLHPARYRTMPCKDGRRCRRKVCFFAHSPRQLRLLPSIASADPTTPIPSPGSTREPSRSAVWPAASSPTSTLRGFSPPISPSGGPLQPSRCTTAGNNSNTTSNTNEECGVLFSSGVMGYDSLYEELMSSLGAMELSGTTASTSYGIGGAGARSSPSFSTSSVGGLMEGTDLVEQRSSNRRSSCGLDQ